MTKKQVRRWWLDQDKDQLLSFRNSGKTKEEFVKEFDRPWTAISKQLSKCKIEYWGSTTDSVYIIQTNIKDICVRYRKGERISSIQKDYPLSKVAVLRHLRLNNIPIRPDQYTHALRYKINENYFDSIDTEDKAYYLGLLFADGCNNTITRSTRIELQARDKHILYSFRKSLGSTAPIKFIDRSKYPNTQNAYRFDIFNRKIVDSLNKLGMHNNKYFTCDFPNIDTKLYNHFIRGYFDGDGSIFSCMTPRDRTPKFGFNITGNILIVDKIQDILVKEIGLNKIKLQTRYKAKQNSTRSFCYSGNRQCIKIREYLYKDATVYLTRKHNKFHQINMVP